MLKFFKNKDVSYICILFAIIIAFGILSLGKHGSIFYDTYKEFLIPQAILEHKVFYRDIFCLYPPLGYYLNAVFVFLFGNSLAVFQSIGTCCFLILISAIYMIVKRVSSSDTAFLTSFLILSICALKSYPNLGDCYLPYSFPLFYAFTACIISFLFLVCFLKNHNKPVKYLYFASFFIGLSIAFKFDFFALSFLIFLYIVLQKSFKVFCISLFAIIFPLFFSFCLYLLTGGTIVELYDQILLINKFFHSEVIQQFMSNSIPQFLTKEIIFNIIYSFCMFVFSFGFSIWVASILVDLFYRKKFVPTIILSIFVLFFICIETNYWNNKLSLFSNAHFDMVFLPYLLLFTFCINIIRKIFHKEQIKEIDQIFFIGLLAAFLIAYRNIAAIYISNIGNFTIIPMLMLFVFVFVEYIPSLYSANNFKKIKNTLFCAILLYSLIYVSVNLCRYNNLQYKLDFPKGPLYVSSCDKELVSIVKNTTEQAKAEGKTVLSLVESSWVNYYFDMPFDSMYYSLHSHFAALYGDDVILNYLKKQMPDYIYILIPFSYDDTSNDEFGINYAKSSIDFINSKYDQKCYLKPTWEFNGIRVYEKRNGL